MGQFDTPNWSAPSAQGLVSEGEDLRTTPALGITHRTPEPRSDLRYRENHHPEDDVTVRPAPWKGMGK